jgi:hypothetical protein
MVDHSPAPTVRKSVIRILQMFKRLGTDAQKAEAIELEKQLAEPDEAEAVSFATADDEQPKGEGK